MINEEDEQLAEYSQNDYLPINLTSLVIKDWSNPKLQEIQKGAEIMKAMCWKGTATFFEDHIYTGNMRNGKMNGDGQFTWKDGTVYEGKFKNNEISGYGKYKWKDGTTYKGNVKNGIRHGVGVFKNPKEGYMYDGEWKHGLRHGKGKLQYNYQKEGFEGYDGNWKEGEKCGFGKYVYPSGNIYEGEWEHNKRNGKGTMIWAEDKDKKRPQEKYIGQWKDDLQNGFGTHIWMDTQSENKILRNRYVGYWKNGTREGHGVFFYGNGSKYVGQWKNNMKDGWGKFIYEDGNEFEGCYLKDRIVDSSKISEGKTITAGIQAATDLSNVQHIHEKLEKKSAAKPPAKGEKTMKETIRSPHSTKGKQEVDENPFSKMIDSSDLIAIENLKSKVLSGREKKVEK